MNKERLLELAGVPVQKKQKLPTTLTEANTGELSPEQQQGLGTIKDLSILGENVNDLIALINRSYERDTTYTKVIADLGIALSQHIDMQGVQQSFADFEPKIRQAEEDSAGY